jgi:[acyl-carrier-protein] S-malonyltransferase
MPLYISEYENNHKIGNLNTAFLFPGSGVELSGHEKLFYENHPDFCKPFREICQTRTSLDIESVLYPEGEARFNDLEMQYFTYTLSAITASFLYSKGLFPKLTGGYSMGLYAAAYASGCISFETGLDIIKTAYETMDDLFGKQKGGLYAIVGLTADEISELVDSERRPTVALSVVSSEASLVYSGVLNELNDFARECEENGAYKTVRLNADFPYHNPGLLKKAPDAFRKKIEGMEFHDTSIDLFSTFSGKNIHKPDELKEEIADHLATPISWLELLKRVHTDHFDIAIECGPGLTLTQISRFVPDRIKYWNIRNMEGRISKL